MSRYFDPKNDVAFKRLFAREENKPLLISFLNSTLRRQGDDEIQDVEILPTELAPDVAETKRSILDVRCRDKKNFQYIVEMQNYKQALFLQRAQYYVAKTYSGQLSKGEEYLELRPVILLAILNDTLFPDDVKSISYHHTLEVETAKHYLKDMSYAFIELPKFTKSIDALTSVEDYWLHLFKQAHEDQNLPPNAPQEIAKAYDTLEQYKWSAQEKEAYERAQMAILDETDRLKTAKEEGREEGREEERLEIARKMLAKGLEMSVVAEMTGLTVEQIAALQEESR